MIRNIVHIDQDKCDGCGLCVSACHEGAIGIVNGRAQLLRDDYCDGLGNCLPACPANAITIIQREAKDYDEAAVVRAIMDRAKAESHVTMPSHGCPSSQVKYFKRSIPSTSDSNDDLTTATATTTAAASRSTSSERPSRLSQWPIQIKLAPSNAPFFHNADLLIAADCCAFSYGNFHDDFIAGKVCLIGCPKLDGVNYSEKLSEICANNSIRSITVCRMEVPCCGGIEFAAKAAVDISHKDIPIQVVTITTDGLIKSAQ